MISGSGQEMRRSKRDSKRFKLLPRYLFGRQIGLVSKIAGTHYPIDINARLTNKRRYSSQGVEVSRAIKTVCRIVRRGVALTGVARMCVQVTNNKDVKLGFGHN